MKEEIAKKAVEILNGKALNERINDVIYNELGVRTNLKASYRGSRDFYVIMEDSNDDANNQMTSTPLLRQLFKAFMIESRVYFDEDMDIFVLGIRCSYDHNYDGGSNGHDLMDVRISSKGEILRVSK